MAQAFPFLVAPNGQRAAVSPDMLEIELLNAVPVPPSAARFTEILEFKAKRADQLAAFRLYLDELYQDILLARDVERARVTAHERLAKALRELHKVMNESLGKRILSSLKIQLSLEHRSVQN
jgi:uncharacterized protein DUF6236